MVQTSSSPRICLNASGWKSREDFYAALLPELGAPEWHGRNLDALYDSLSGGINELEPPFKIVVSNTAGLSAEMADFLALVAKVFADARAAFGYEVLFEAV